MNTPQDKTFIPRIHIIRHGQSLHNVERGYPHRDPPLTEKGEDDAKCIRLRNNIDDKPHAVTLPDLILISPMTRAIQTAKLAFPSIFQSFPFAADVNIWPELREAHDANCNKGSSRAALEQKFLGFDFSKCPQEWDHPPHTIENATLRAESVRKRLADVAESGQYRNIALVTHRGFIAFLVPGDRYDVCETRSYRFATSDEINDDSLRFGTNVDTGERQDFGPTLLLPISSDRKTDDPV